MSNNVTATLETLTIGDQEERPLKAVKIAGTTFDFDSDIDYEGAGITFGFLSLSDSVMTQADFDAFNSSPIESANLEPQGQQRWFPAKLVNESYYYGITVDANWIGGAEIDDISIDVEKGSQLVVRRPSFDSILNDEKPVKRAFALFSGGTPGTHRVTITIYSGKLVKVVKAYIIVKR
jgi:hypothetical protein